MSKKLDEILEAIDRMNKVFDDWIHRENSREIKSKLKDLLDEEDTKDSY